MSVEQLATRYANLLSETQQTTEGLVKRQAVHTSRSQRPASMAILPSQLAPTATSEDSSQTLWNALHRAIAQEDRPALSTLLLTHDPPALLQVLNDRHY